MWAFLAVFVVAVKATLASETAVVGFALPFRCGYFAQHLDSI
jgi:hypothetical protein